MSPRSYCLHEVLYSELIDETESVGFITSILFINRAMNITCIGSGWFPESPGGLERYVYDLSDYLSRRGEQVHFFSQGNPQSLRPNFHAYSLGNPLAPILPRLWDVRKNLRYSWPKETDLINPHLSLYTWPALDLLPKHIPMVCHFHGPWAEESHREGASRLTVACKKWVEQSVFRRCSSFITLSHAFKKLLHESYEVPEEIIRVIPGGIDTEIFKLPRTRAEARQKLGWPQDRFIVFTPRRLVRRMGLSQLIEAVSILKKPDIWLGIAGRGPLSAELAQQIQDLDIGHQVCLLGFISDQELVLAYQAADLTVVPSQMLEGFGLILAESLACGTPAIATPVGAMPEVLQPLSPQLITPGTDSKAIAQTLSEVLSGVLPLPEPDKCRGYAHTNFAWPVVIEQVFQVFSQKS
jgi:glycosyltransferase involved in cell wall biosynthesis